MRDVIRVERLPDLAPGSLDQAPGSLDTGRTSEPGWTGPAIDSDSLAAVGRVADEVLPSIVARLAVSGLGELEVRHGDWRIRVRRAMTPESGIPTTGVTIGDPAPGAEPSSTAGSPVPGRPSTIATSPAVGYAAPRPELGVGARVGQGDVIGWVEVLGVRQEVVAPVDGLVGKWLVESGDPVEYGQELVQLVPAGTTMTRAGQDEAGTR